MSNQNETEQTDLTTPEAVAVGQEVYARLTPGQDVEAELNAAYGRNGK
ncbi:hypothetical protein [Streptomyces sp. NPDC056227]